MTRKGIDFWNIKDNRLNAKPITDTKIEKEIIHLRSHLDTVAIKFNQLVGNFAKIASHMSPLEDRYWGSSHIEVIVSRSENDEIFIEVHRRDDPDQNNPSLTLGFQKPKKWDKHVLSEPICASGQTKEEIILLGDLLLIEWPKCQKLKYRKVHP